MQSTKLYPYLLYYQRSILYGVVNKNYLDAQVILITYPTLYTLLLTDGHQYTVDQGDHEPPDLVVKYRGKPSFEKVICLRTFCKNRTYGVLFERMSTVTITIITTTTSVSIRQEFYYFFVVSRYFSSVTIVYLWTMKLNFSFFF